MDIVDLRRDTVTKPTPALRKSIAEAEVGDDVFAEDPTINRLQDMVAELLGKEAALFVPSGTMSNQIAINCHTQLGDEVIIERDSHSFHYEGGGPTLLSGVQLCTLPGVRGARLWNASVVTGIPEKEYARYFDSISICVAFEPHDSYLSNRD